MSPRLNRENSRVNGSGSIHDYRAENGTVNPLAVNPTASPNRRSQNGPPTNEEDYLALLNLDDGEKINSNIRAKYERNSGLDLDGDGFISVGELGSRIKNKMSDFGIEDLTLPDEDLSSITLPPIGDTGGSPELAQTSAPFDVSNIETNEITDTDSGIPFIDVISNPFLSVA